jgi:hypothetical protein
MPAISAARTKVIVKRPSSNSEGIGSHQEAPKRADRTVHIFHSLTYSPAWTYASGNHPQKHHCLWSPNQ